MKIRSYSELVNEDGFDERFEYLRLGGSVGHSTFGFDRYINQRFYRSREWKDVRNHVIYRDSGCDLGCEGYEINASLMIHHMNPVVPENITNKEAWILDPEYLITTTHNTHNAIHYSDKSLLPKTTVERLPGDTKLW